MSGGKQSVMCARCRPRSSADYSRWPAQFNKNWIRPSCNSEAIRLVLNVAERFARDHLELQTALEPPSVTRIVIVGTMIEWLKDWARSIKQDVHALYLASRDPRVPWYAKAMGLLVAGYALSPIDLIPDFICTVLRSTVQRNRRPRLRKGHRSGLNVPQ